MMRVCSMVVILSMLAGTGTAAAADLELGKKVFAARCAMCHGPDGKGSAKMASMLKVSIPDLTTVPAKSDTEVLKLVSEGKQPMPSFGKALSKDEIEAVVHYTKALGHGQVVGK